MIINTWSGGSRRRSRNPDPNISAGKFGFDPPAGGYGSMEFLSVTSKRAALASRQGWSGTNGGLAHTETRPMSFAVGGVSVPKPIQADSNRWALLATVGSVNQRRVL